MKYSGAYFATWKTNTHISDLMTQSSSTLYPDVKVSDMFVRCEERKTNEQSAEMVCIGR